MWGEVKKQGLFQNGKSFGSVVKMSMKLVSVAGGWMATVEGAVSYLCFLCLWRFSAEISGSVCCATD